MRVDVVEAGIFQRDVARARFQCGAQGGGFLGLGQFDLPVIAEAGGALIHPESVLDVPGLTRDIRAILNDPARASQMASAALSLARPDAARRLYDLVTEIAR